MVSIQDNIGPAVKGIDPSVGPSTGDLGTGVDETGVALAESGGTNVILGGRMSDKPMSKSAGLGF